MREKITEVRVNKHGKKYRFCGYFSNALGICGMVIWEGDDGFIDSRCEKHLGLKSQEKIIKKHKESRGKKAEVP